MQSGERGKPSFVQMIRMSKQNLLSIILLALVSATILLVFFLDYYNIERYPSSGSPSLYFERTWKGRMFYLVFVWVLVMEHMFEWKRLGFRKADIRVVLSAVFAVLPLLYVLSLSFLGFDSSLITLGRAVLLPDYASGQNLSFLTEHWPLSVEYILFTVFFLSSFVLMYGRATLRFFPISFSIIGGIGLFYMIDTIYPFSLFAPLQTIAIPTAACAAVLAQWLGYKAVLNLYWSNPAPQLMIIKTVDQRVTASVAWPCAGVQSLFIYVIIMLLVLRKLRVTTARAVVYFVVGAVGTFSVNVIRVVAFYVAYLEISPSMGVKIHDVYGELFFLGWMGLFLSAVFCIERFHIIERVLLEKDKLLLRLNALVTRHF